MDHLFQHERTVDESKNSAHHVAKCSCGDWAKTDVAWTLADFSHGFLQDRWIAEHLRPMGLPEPDHACPKCGMMHSLNA